MKFFSRRTPVQKDEPKQPIPSLESFKTAKPAVPAENSTSKPYVFPKEILQTAQKSQNELTQKPPELPQKGALPKILQNKPKPIPQPKATILETNSAPTPSSQTPQQVREKIAEDTKNAAVTAAKLAKAHAELEHTASEEVLQNIDAYEFYATDIPISVQIVRKKGEFVPVYEVSISSVSRTTEFILEKIRQELIKKINMGIIDLTDEKKQTAIEESFRETIEILIKRYFPDLDDNTKGFLSSYLVLKSLGLGNLELLMADINLEEIVINDASEPVWIFHKKHGWLKTNIFMRDEEQTKHYAAVIGRKVGRQITILEPLLDAHLDEGDRVNATLMPISTAGNTMTIRKFARDPWTIPKFIRAGTISAEAAALIWLAMEYEMSAIIAGGTASGKTSMLNVAANFFPPNQRIISIEDTREIQLPKFLHWVPLSTRLANAERKGEVSMEDLLVNSLRMRPDRILVGEVRRKREAETLFEAIHTGHSVYATFHANNAKETIERLTNPPIDVPKVMLPAISLIIVQFRNRRSGKRRTFQVAEITETSEANVLLQYDATKDALVWANKSRTLFENLRLYTGMSLLDIQKDLKDKEKILDYLVKLNIDTIDGVGRTMAEYYTNRANLMKAVASGKPFA